MIRKIVKKKLRIISRLILKRHKPDIIAVTGSIGKTSTKEACYLVLSQKYRVRKSERNLNTEIGVPLTIIGADAPNRSVVKWVFAFLKGLFVLMMPSRLYPEIVILEMGADKPGDISYFMSFVCPTVGLVTTVSHVHLSQFSKLSQIVAEKRQIIEHTEKKGFVVLNKDDERVWKMREKTSARVVSYSMHTDADVRAEELNIIEKDQVLGVHFKLMYKDTVTPVFVPNIAGVQFVSSLLAAAAVGLVYQMTPLEVAQGLENFKPLYGRFLVYKGKTNITVIDDTYNAAPVSTCAALVSLHDFPRGKRKIAVLADMLELGSYEEKGHREVGRCVVSQKIDLLLTYGNKARVILDEAKKLRLPIERGFHFDSKDTLITFLKEHIQSKDVILVKGSRGMAMEDVVKALVG